MLSIALFILLIFLCIEYLCVLVYYSIVIVWEWVKERNREKKRNRLSKLWNSLWKFDLNTLRGETNSRIVSVNFYSIYLDLDLAFAQTVEYLYRSLMIEIIQPDPTTINTVLLIIWFILCRGGDSISEVTGTCLVHDTLIDIDPIEAFRVMHILHNKKKGGGVIQYTSWINTVIEYEVDKNGW